MKWFLGLFLTSCFGMSLAWARPEVVFPSQVEVSNTAVISLFQVAELKDLNGVAFHELAKLTLAEPKEDQEVLVLSGVEVSKKLRDFVKTSETLKKLNPVFRIPSEIEIKIRKYGISREEIERSLMNILLEKCPTCEYGIRITSLPKMNGRNWNVDWGGEIRNGGFMLPVMENEGNSNKWITGSLKIQKYVPVTKKWIRFGERVQREDVEVSLADITFLKEESPKIEEIVGQVANRSLTPRTPVVLSDLKREPATKKGQMVKALVGTDVFEITTNVLAEDNGFVGDQIKVKNLETQKIMSATVVEKGVVKVQ